ncbi:MAG: glucosaminidase domain-containing protein [Bacteroidales bacterium]|nr:glucosaminidase domain-containing protein [Bacteroidales bacterium]
MKRLFFTLLTLWLTMMGGSLRAQYTTQDVYVYIDTYKELAINKMYEYKIPASITIAQGIFESACGMSHLAKDGNNHFGIKCHKDWTGDTILIDDDELQECFRKYEKVEDSYTDHSEFLSKRPRYADLFKLDVMDYPGWARGLKAAGYATNPQYADRLISLIERFHLADLDTIYQQRLQNGYFDRYPNLSVDDLADISFVAKYGQPGTPTPPAVAPTPQPKPQPTVREEPRSDGAITVTPARPQRHKPLRPGKKTQANPNHRPASGNNPPASQATKPQHQQKPQPQAQPQAQPQPQPQTQPQKPQPQDQPATEVQSATELPTQLTVFSARDGEYPVVPDYPFTERTVYKNNNVFFVIAKGGDTYSKIAADVQIKVKKLRKFNDEKGAGKLKVGQVVYIERKRNVGIGHDYKVQNTESMLYIAQKNAMKIKKLCDLNGLPENAQLKKGRVLKLR